jgi:hypothetical protein
VASVLANAAFSEHEDLLTTAQRAGRNGPFFERYARLVMGFLGIWKHKTYLR